MEGWAPGSAVQQLVDEGIQMEKIVVGKPISTLTASVGYVDPGTLLQMGCRAKSELGFSAGFMTWMYASDRVHESNTWASTLNVPCPGDPGQICR